MAHQYVLLPTMQLWTVQLVHLGDLCSARRAYELLGDKIYQQGFVPLYLANTLAKPRRS